MCLQDKKKGRLRARRQRNAIKLWRLEGLGYAAALNNLEPHHHHPCTFGIAIRLLLSSHAPSIAPEGVQTEQGGVGRCTNPISLDDDADKVRMAKPHLSHEQQSANVQPLGCKFVHRRHIRLPRDLEARTVTASAVFTRRAHQSRTRESQQEDS